MNDNKSKKELQSQYKERRIVGGVYAIKNTLTNKLLLDASTDLQASKNRFDFSRQTGSCVYPKLQTDWTKHGSSQFAFVVLEELEMGETQTPDEFKADVSFLKDIWIEKLSDDNLY